MSEVIDYLLQQDYQANSSSILTNDALKMINTSDIRRTPGYSEQNSDIH